MAGEKILGEVAKLFSYVYNLDIRNKVRLTRGLKSVCDFDELKFPWYK